jgi:hypothetical protein
MERRARGALGALLAIGGTLVAVSSAPARPRTTGSQYFDGGLVVSSASGQRKVIGSVVAGRGVFAGVGRIVERPNRPGDSDKVSRDDLVFPTGVLHILNTNGRPSFAVNRRTCKATFKVQQTTMIDGGTGRFAGATGRFAGAVTGTGVARRKPDSSCDQAGLPMVEVDTISMTGTLTL